LTKLAANDAKVEKNKIFWWFDVSLNRITSGAVNQLVSSFGLPNDDKLRSSFKSFGSVLSKDARIFVGENRTTNNDNVSSLTFVTQSIWLKNRPIVHYLPSYLESTVWTENAFGRMVADYYAKRFAFLFNLTWLSDTMHEEKHSAAEGAESLAAVRFFLKILILYPCILFLISKLFFISAHPIRRIRR
jgi:hypothetical protein